MFTATLVAMPPHSKTHNCTHTAFVSV
jgi:hypothetical protein